MTTRWQLSVVTLCMVFVAPLALHADIDRWYNGQLIPGTEGITPGPGVQLDHMHLEHAQLSQTDLTGANIEASNPDNAMLTYAALANTNLTGATVPGARLWQTRRVVVSGRGGEGWRGKVFAASWRRERAGNWRENGFTERSMKAGNHEGQ